MSERRLQHPDAARLLAYLDREVGFWGAFHIRRHVERCWQCRARVAEIESAIHGVARRLPPPNMSAAELAKARWKFRQSAADFELEAAAVRRVPWLKLAPAAAALIVCAALIGFRSKPSDPPPPAGAMLAAAMAAERPDTGAPVQEEEFTLDYQSGSTGKSNRGRLNLIAAPGAGTYSARWSDQRGVLRHAVYASDRRAGEEFTTAHGLQPAMLARPDHPKLLYEYADGGSEDLESMILAWMRQQVWEPVSLAREVAEFCTRTGAVLQVTLNGRAVLWNAQSTVNGFRFEVHLQGFRDRPPRVLRVTWQSARGSGMIRVSREARREYKDLRLAAAWLYPEASMRRPPKRPAVPPPAPAPPVLRELLAAEIEVLYALHRAELCKAGELRVVRRADGVEVSGVLAGEQQVAAVAALLSGIGHVRLLLSAFSEPAVQLGAASTFAAAQKPPRPAAAEAWLRNRLGVGVRASEREMFDTMNAVVRDSEELLAHSWAVFHLAERFPPGVEGQIEAGARAKLRTIVDDHVVALSVHLAGIDGRLALQQTDGVVQPSTIWQDDSRTLHREAKKTADLLVRLFAGGEGGANDPQQVGLAGFIAHVRSHAAAVREGLGASRSARRQ